MGPKIPYPWLVDGTSDKEEPGMRYTPPYGQTLPSLSVDKIIHFMCYIIIVQVLNLMESKKIRLHPDIKNLTM